MVPRLSAVGTEVQGARYLLRKRSNLRPEEKPVKVTRYKRCGIKYENPEIVNDLYRSRGLLELIFSSLGAGIDSVTVPYPGTDPVLNLGTDVLLCSYQLSTILRY